MSSFTCITCRVAFNDAEIQRSHYKTDWHRYNLKRKVANLPSVTAENFQQRVLAQRHEAAEQEKDTSGHCDLCNKHFSSRNAYDNHIKSKKHKDMESKRKEKQAEKGLEDTKVQEKNAKNAAIQNAMKAEKPGSSAVIQNATKAEKPGSSAAVEEDEDMDSDAESWESWDGEAIGLEECLFCSHLSRTLEKNISHMSREHSFFMPDSEYIVDLEGLITYLGQKVGEGHICLWCNEKGRAFYTTKAVQQHMIDKGHTKMMYDGDAVFEYADFYDYRKSYPDFAADGAARMDVDEDEEEEEVSLQVMTEDNYQLVLPSGATIGHRSLQRYYRQNLQATDKGKNPHVLAKVLAQYKALGWTGTTGVDAAKRAKDVAYCQRMRFKQRLHLGTKANKFQKYFRPQVVF